MEETKVVLEDLSKPKLIEKYRRLGRVHDATNLAVEGLHRKIELLEAEVGTLTKQVASAEQQAEQQKSIARTRIAEAQAEKDGLVAEIIELREKLREAV